jgi:hypothetical protein
MSEGNISQLWKGAGPRRVKFSTIKWAKLNLTFDKLFSAWKIGHI